MIAARLLPALTLLLAGCLVDFPPLPADGGAQDSSADAPAGDIAAADGLDLQPTDSALPDGPAAEGPAPDTGPPDTSPPTPDASPCSAWSLWSCSSSGNSCSAACPATGAAVLQLECNKNNCTCSNGANSKQCSASGAGCSGCQSAFQAGCCDGL